MLPPVWFTDTAAVPVINLLRWFVQQLNQISQDERQRALTRKLSSRTIPALFDYTDADEIDFLWEAMRELAAPPYEIWTLIPEKSVSTISDKSTKLILNDSAESLLRQWLNMPLVDPLQAIWIDAIFQRKNSIPFDTQGLAQSIFPGIYSADQLIDALVSLHTFVASAPQEKLTWRRLSARFFFGDSKYLDSNGRQQWLLTILPSLPCLILDRTILCNVHLVNQPRGILLIENLDTFCWLRDIGAEIPCTRHLHLVYSQGFMGSAQRIRTRQSVQFSLSGVPTEVSRFEEEWLGDSEMSLPCFFWGDLDFSGLTILKALRQTFPFIAAWQPGYAPMVEAAEQGGGHTPEQADKLRQLAPVECGCEYADQVLLPCLQKSQHFIDQEWVSRRMLMG